MTSEEQIELYEQLVACAPAHLRIEMCYVHHEDSADDPYIFIMDTSREDAVGYPLCFNDDDIDNSGAIVTLVKELEREGGWWLETPVYFKGVWQPQPYGCYFHHGIMSYHGREEQCRLGDTMAEAVVRAYIYSRSFSKGFPPKTKRV